MSSPGRTSFVAEGSGARAAPWQRELLADSPLAVAYDLWLGSWETALAALASATRSGLLGASEAAAHRSVVVAEREVVTRHFTLLVGHTAESPVWGLLRSGGEPQAR